MSRRLELDAAFAVLVVLLLVVLWVGRDAVPDADTSLVLARAVRLVAVGAVVGLAVVVLAVWRPLRRAGRIEPPADAAFGGAAGWLLRRVAILGAIAALVALALQTAIGGPVGLVHVVAPDRWGTALDDRSGAWLGASVVAFVGVAIAGPAAVRGAALRSRSWLVTLGALGILVVAPAIGGVPVPEPRIGGLVVPPVDVLRVVLEIVHVAAMGAWIGGLLTLLVVLPAATRSLADGAARTRLLAAVLLRFSPVALVAVVLLTAAGTGIALVSLTTLYDLADTAYGRAVFVKVVLLLVAIGIAVVQREYLVPRLERAAGAPSVDGPNGDGPPPDPVRARRDVRRAMLGEALLLAAVLLVTGALVGSTPPKQLADAPASVVRDVGGQRWTLTVEPARVGPTTVTLSVLGSRGEELARGHRVAMRALPPGRAGSSDQPVDVRMAASAPGFWTAAGVELGARGRWTLAVRLRAPDGGSAQASFPVRIR